MPKKEKANMIKKQFCEKLRHQIHEKGVFSGKLHHFLLKWAKSESGEGEGKGI